MSHLWQCIEALMAFHISATWTHLSVQFNSDKHPAMKYTTRSFLLNIQSECPIILRAKRILDHLMSNSLTGIFWELTMQGGCCKELKMWIRSKFSSILMRIRECSWPPQVILLPLLSLYYYLLPTMIPSHVEYRQRKTSRTIFLKYF